MVKISILRCGILFALVIVNSACASQNCTFSEEIISEKHYSENSLISVYRWFPKTNEIKGVLSNGNLFSVKHWSCNHYGKQAIIVIVPQIQSIPSELNEYILLLAKVALDDSEQEFMINAIGGKSIKLSDLPQKLYFPSDEFDEFYLLIGIVGESIVLEIKLYAG